VSVIVLAATDNGFDWTKLIGIPGAVAALIGIPAYLVGFIHLIAVQGPSYWHDGNCTRMKVAIKNRNLLYDRNLEKIVLYKVPGFLKRTFTRKWRTHTVPIVPWDCSARGEQSRQTHQTGGSKR